MSRRSIRSNFLQYWIEMYKTICDKHRVTAEVDGNNVTTREIQIFVSAIRREICCCILADTALFLHLLCPGLPAQGIQKCCPTPRTANKSDVRFAWYSPDIAFQTRCNNFQIGCPFDVPAAKHICTILQSSRTVCNLCSSSLDVVEKAAPDPLLMRYSISNNVNYCAHTI